MTTTELTDAWILLFPRTELPSKEQWAVWLLLHDSATVKDGIAQLATKYQKLHGSMTRDYMIRFASAVMNRIKREKKGVA